MIVVKRFKFDESDLSKIAFTIRTKVFVEEQHVEPCLEYDGYDQNAQHYLVLKNDEAVGTARWRYTEKGIKLERFAILSKYRNDGIGSVLLKEVLQDIIKLNKTIYLHSQLRAVPYYERMGFQKQGKLFEEAGIQHYFMVFTHLNE
ncbi:GNAT family N-acetyltransferase [Bacteroidota bacterium]